MAGVSLQFSAEATINRSQYPLEVRALDESRLHILVTGEQRIISVMLLPQRSVCDAQLMPNHEADLSNCTMFAGHYYWDPMDARRGRGEWLSWLLLLFR